MREFQVGDIVECIEDEKSSKLYIGLVKGNIYKIKDIGENKFYITLSGIPGKSADPWREVLDLLDNSSTNFKILLNGGRSFRITDTFHISRFILKQDLMRDNKLKQSLNEKI